MKAKKPFLALSVILITALGDGILAGDMAGRQIMERQKELQEVDSEYTEQIIMLVDKDGNKEKRTLRIYWKELEEDLERSLVVYLSPADIAGTSVLTWEHRNTENDQWLYVPATKKLRRIAKSSRKSYFMGTDLTYEDMEPERMNNFDYSVQGGDTLNVDGSDWDCWVIQVVPADPQRRRESGYAKRLLWIDREYYITLKVEFYDRRERLIKTQTFYSLTHVEGTVWRPKKMLMDNTSKSHQTLGLLVKHEVNRPIDNDVFTERFILSGKHTD